ERKTPGQCDPLRPEGLGREESVDGECRPKPAREHQEMDGQPGPMLVPDPDGPTGLEALRHPRHMPAYGRGVKRARLRRPPGAASLRAARPANAGPAPGQPPARARAA